MADVVVTEVAPVTPEPDKAKYVSLDRHLDEERKFKAKIAEGEAAKAALEAKLAEYEAEKKKKADAELSEIDRLKKERADLDAKASKADKYEARIKSSLEAAKQAIPEDRRGLVPDSLPIEDQLEYIERNRAFLMETPKKPKIDEGKPKAKEGADENVTVTPDDVENGWAVYGVIPGMTREEAGKKWAKAHPKG